jgi:diaminopimelate epimerase
MGGTNVNFVQPRPDGSLHMRTYERGVENETYSCGTGAVAAALTAHLAGILPKQGHEQVVHISTVGGNLLVSFQIGEEKFSEIWLNGPAQQVYHGAIEL